jgi:hypothetical protein
MLILLVVPTTKGVPILEDRRITGQVVLVTTDRSWWLSRLSGSHPWVDEARKPAGEQYVVDTEKKTLLLPGESEPFTAPDILVASYEAPDQEYCYLVYYQPDGFIQQAISFMKLQAQE